MKSHDICEREAGVRHIPEDLTGGGLILRSLESVETRGFGRSKDVGPGVGSVGVLPRSK